MQGYIYNDNNISMYTYMIIYDYNIHIYYIVYEYRSFYSLNSTVYNSRYIYIYIYIYIYEIHEDDTGS